MERVCCILMRRKSYKTTFACCFKCFSTCHRVKTANLTHLSRRSADVLSQRRRFNTFSRLLSIVIDDKDESDRKIDNITNVDDDFFGFEGSGIEIKGDPSVNPLIKYGAMFKRVQKPDEDKVYVVSYGTVRFDNDNYRYHTSETVLESDNEFDEGTRPGNGSRVLENDLNATQELRNKSETVENDQHSDLRSDNDLNDLFNNEYFSEISQRSLPRNLTIRSQLIENGGIEPSELKNLSKSHKKDSIELRESRNWRKSPENDQKGALELDNESQNDFNHLFNEQFFSEITKISFKEPDKCQLPSNYIDELYFSDSYAETDETSAMRRATNVSPIPETEIRSHNFDPETALDVEIGEKPVQTDKTMTAFDYVLKIRAQRAVSNANDSTTAEKEPKRSASGGGSGSKENGNSLFKLDGKGFRIYKNQTTDLENETEMEVLHLLKKSVLYNENDIVAISKPYGLQCHPGSGHRHSLTKYLPQLAKFLGRDGSNPELYTVHRLDIDTTGILLLAKTQEMAKRLHDMLAFGKIGKAYWALTKGVPSPSEGIVDIPMAEGSVDGKMRMVLRPVASDEAKLLFPKYSGKTHRAITSYCVIGSHGNAALVELKPMTGVKHQLRVHLAFALGCPILGDHKYSHLSKLAPQKLPSDVLQRLHLRQSKVRYLPMHLHSRGVAIPDVVEGRDIVIGARLPKHFKQNLERLKIEYKSVSTSP